MGSSGVGGFSGVANLTYAGYNTVGGTFENMPGFRTYMKQIVLAKTSLLIAIESRIKSVNTNNAAALGAGVFTDSAGSPALVIGYYMDGVHGLYINTTDRWVSVPINKLLTAGTYWIAVQASTVGGVTNLALAYDATGTDVVATQAQTGQYMADPSLITPPALTVTANQYSIRASLLS